MKLSLIFILSFSLTFGTLQAQGQACTVTTDAEGTLSDDCPALHDCIENICIHKDIFPLTWRELLGGVLIMVLSGFSNTGGIGGGSILTPVLLTLYSYSTSKSIMLVYVLIFGGSLGNFLNVAFQKDIQTGKPIVIYDFALIITPLMLLGSNIGVILNRMIAPIFTICGLLYLVATTTMKIYQRAKTSYAKETEMLQNPLLESPQKLGGTEMKQLNEESNLNSEESQYPEELKVALEEEKSALPRSRVTFLAYLFLFVVLVILLKGSEKFPSAIGIGYCSTGYWIWFVLGLVGCYFFYQKGLALVRQKDSLKKQHGIVEQEFNISDDNIKKTEKLGILAGVLGALLGIGGGMILGTQMLAMGMGAQKMTATCGLFVFLTAFINLIQAFLYGGITTGEIVYFFLVTSVGSYAVSTFLSWLVKIYKRPSILLFSLAGIMGVTLVILPLSTIYKAFLNPGQMIQFHSPC